MEVGYALPKLEGVTPVAATAAVGQAVQFTARAIGQGMSYQWKKGGRDIAGATLAVLNIESVQPEDQGTYEVEVRNESGAVSGKAVLVVNSVSIGKQPESVQAVSGRSVRFEVTAYGSGKLEYQWSRDGVALVGGTGSVLELSNVDGLNAGVYGVEVRSGAAVVRSQSAVLTLLNPVVINQAQMKAQERMLVGGELLRLEASASGTGPLEYKWYKNGALLSGVSGRVLEVPQATVSHAGTYTVVVSSGTGAYGSSAESVGVVIGAHRKPAIASMTPAGGVMVSVGGTVSFAVGASGAEPLSYQWRRGGDAIAGGTSSVLVQKFEEIGDGAFFDVVVSNPAGSVVSGVRRVQVRRPAEFLAPIGNRVVGEGSDVVWSGSLAGTELRYQWKRNGASIVGGSAAVLRLGSVGAVDGGVYRGSCLQV